MLLKPREDFYRRAHPTPDDALLTNGFSKKVDNHKAMIALHYMHYNFARIHKTLRVTPAMEAGISDHVWSLEEIAQLTP
jgi:hypothetical protein